ncbi:hypothetical protein TVAG_327740 [Trichomonas vaginalis G3]|uniref:Uncharacterized protein n=1 Tax=Trichomonas vaginalis (strain ATCC PRA-98 / G3) TaxID=412133 RepID=A2G076_TRIV3|nr:ubiquitinyl hydrolase protein [Trichomonas vaginalis G3]EAX89432.1 hypothetical protein TVAG_327740 [Trichomonas vaginalis G3]KAI5517849.1 ubiquitinyl hydrolase protein [Trichomonas vaginalis G3]|eukprot:XP_001302362.1 hypothetical protein [Trichomonas vaginalis G3]
MTNDMEYITFRHIINKDQKFKLLVPLLFSYENILKLISCKLQKNSDQILLFKPNDVRSLHKSTHPNVKAILEAMDMIDPSDDMTICFDIAPESVKTVDRSDITVIDKNGKTKQRFAIYLPRGDQSNERLIEEINKTVTDKYKYFYSVNGFPRDFVPGERVEFNHRVVLETELEEPENDEEVLLRVVNRDQLLGDNGKLPYYIKEKSDKKVDELLKEISTKTGQIVHLIKGTSRRPEIADHKDLLAKDIVNMNIAVITKISLSALYGESSELKMNK